MFTEARKKQLVEKVIRTDDESLLESIEKILRKPAVTKRSIKKAGTATREIRESKKNYQKMIKGNSPYKRKVLNGLKQAVKEMQLIKQGKLKAVPAKQLFNEL